jgi:hypothetical protein
MARHSGSALHKLLLNDLEIEIVRVALRSAVESNAFAGPLRITSSVNKILNSTAEELIERVTHMQEEG